MMRARIALLMCCLGGAAWLAGSTLHANPPIKDRKRRIPGGIVDLEPLFRWWTNRHGDRPLYAWAHLVGTVVATNAWGWTVEARLDRPPARAHGSGQQESSPSGQVKLALKHPPVSDLEDFSQLTAQAKALSDQAQALSNAVKTAASRAHDLGANTPRSRLRTAEVHQWQLAENQAKAQLAAVRSLLADCHAKLAAFPNSSKYILDCLALDMKQEVNGLPVYDYGVPLTGY